MRNRHPKACSICHGIVPVGEGLLHKDRQNSDWGVTHNGACPRGEEQASIRRGHAQAYSRRVIGLLNHAEASADDIQEAVGGLAALVRTQWTSVQTCERILLHSPALASMDRMSVEEILSGLLLEESHA